MYPLRLVRLIEAHCEEIANDVMRKTHASPRTRKMQEFCDAELHAGMMEILQHLSEWLLTKTDAEIQLRFRQLGVHWACQEIQVADGCWALFLIKDYLWDFVQKQAVLHSPVEIYGGMELLMLLDQFFDRAVCYAVEGYESQRRSEQTCEKPERAKSLEANIAAWVP